jgi:hypothetical protein
VRLFIFATLLACGDTKTTTATSTTTDQVKTNESTASDAIDTTNNSNIDNQISTVDTLKILESKESLSNFPKEIDTLVQKSIETLETSDSNVDTTNTAESKE